MKKYLIGITALLFFVGAGCNLNSETQVESQAKVDAMTQDSGSTREDTLVKDETTNTDALVDVSTDNDVMIKLDEVAQVDAEAMLDTKLDALKKDSDSMKSEDSQKEMEKEPEQKSTGTYQDYNPSKLELASSGKVVLFFKANWCPSCIAFDKSVNANLSAIPAGVHILKVDYDNSAELKKKYGVTYQHTFVQVDAQGNAITKWSGSSSVADVEKRIK